MSVLLCIQRTWAFVQQAESEVRLGQLVEFWLAAQKSAKGALGRVGIRVGLPGFRPGVLRWFENVAGDGPAARVAPRRRGAGDK